jgi:hypothetical protein
VVLNWVYGSIFVGSAIASWILFFFYVLKWFLFSISSSSSNLEN